METNTYLSDSRHWRDHDLLNETSLRHGIAPTWSPRVMVSEPVLSHRQERIWGTEISWDGNGLPIRSVQYPDFRVCRHTHTHVLAFLFPATAKIWILRLRNESMSPLSFSTPWKNPQTLLKVLSESRRSWVLTALLTQNTHSLCLAAYPKLCDNLVWSTSSIILLNKARIPA